MKLSKQERIAAIVVIVLIIIVAGVFLFIKPNIEAINTTKATLETTRKEYDDAVAKAELKGPLKEQILAAYDTGKNMADMFFPELKTYELDNEVRAFLEQCGVEDIVVESLSVTEPGTAGLSSSMFVPPQVQYALKDYVNQGRDTDITKVDPGLIRQALIQIALGDPQTIGASVATFTVKAKTQEAMLAFADAVNNYVKKENGKDVRKAVEINAISFTDEATMALYNERAAGEGGTTPRTSPRAAVDPNTSAPANNDTTSTPTNPTTPPDTTSNPTGTNTSNPTTPNPNTPTTTTTPVNEEQKFFEMSCTMTFYSIERMQSPAEKLAEQDAAV